jgi:UPF0271 protein
MVKEGVVEAVDGSLVKVKADTICVHGDNPQAVDFAKKIKRTLEENGVKVAPMGSFM